ncbi:MAG TPA: glycoside hydrolase [Terriglobales bacterium]
MNNHLRSIPTQSSQLAVSWQAAITLLLILLAQFASAQHVPAEYLNAMKWRMIGPFRGGRITAVSGVPSQPDVYYVGTPGGGVWKTEDGGTVWKPISDGIPVASIGALAVSPSNPSIVYVASGEQTPGDGVYKSIDAGATWVNVGLHDTHVLSGILVDPKNPDVVLVGAAGDYRSGAERGVFKTTDGGKSWQKVLYKDEHWSVVDLEVDPDDPKRLFAVLNKHPEDPFSSDDSDKEKEQDALVYRSNDQGASWTLIEGKGLPTEPMGRVGVAVAPGTKGKRVYAIADQGLFRSEDGGANWQRSTTDPRILGNSYFSRIFVDPHDARNIYVAQTSMYRSIDGGKTFEAWQGAPSGDDYHIMWFNSSDSRRMILGVDQGAVITNDGGLTWSSWYNQPTGQFYHVSTDQQYPYNVYGAQQDSGTAGVPSRTDFGEITNHDWSPVGGFEFSFIEVDPLDPNIVYTGGWYGTVLKFDKTTGQIVHILVRSSKYRTANMAPIAFSPQDPHVLYSATQFVMRTTDRGVTWQEVSPDLTAKTEAKPNPRRAVINCLSLSRVDSKVIWAGTGNGLIQVTQDGKNWQNVTPQNLPERSTITMIESSPRDAGTAYAVVSAFRHQHPLIYRTRDFGKTWQPIVNGLPDDWSARVVRADTVRSGLLFAGTGNAVYFSLDDGDHWQSLQLNLPVCTVTDLAVHSGDLVASTFGRSLWILDDITPLRMVDKSWANAPANLLPPRATVRARWDENQDTPYPPDIPAAKNPPDGAILYYFLQAPPSSVTLSIYDQQKNLVREFSNVPLPIDTAPINAPDYWFEPPIAMTMDRGLNRFVWDLRYPTPKTLHYSYYGQHIDYNEQTLSDHAIPGDTPRDQPQGPFIVPGTYSLVLKVDGQSYTQPLTVTLDPRVHVSQDDLVKQLSAEQSMSAQMAATYAGYDQVTSLRAAIADRLKQASGNPSLQAVTDALKSLDEKAEKIETGPPKDLGFGPINRELGRLAWMIESGDARPADELQAQAIDYCETLAKRSSEWGDLNKNEIPALNTQLQAGGLSTLPVKADIPHGPECK